MMDTKAIPCREIRSEIYIHARQTKLLIWGELSREACQQSNGQLALRSDGTGNWSCITTSNNTHAADVWHANFAVKDEHGITLFGLGPFYSPLMNQHDASRESEWSASFSFPTDLFSRIHGAVQNCGCLPPAHALRQATRPEVLADTGWCRAGMAAALGGAYA